MITIIDLGISNIKSIRRGFAVQGFGVRTASSPNDIRAAGSLVIPGVGAFPRAMEILSERGFIGPILDHAGSGKPLLGVCLGMQLLFTDSEEHGLTRGLGIIPGHVKRFGEGRQVPHMGWNEACRNRETPLFSGIPYRADFYFVHSYIVMPENPADEASRTDHYGWFTSAVQRGNVCGVQFHPEKSQTIGLRLLKNFALLTEREV